MKTYNQMPKNSKGNLTKLALKKAIEKGDITVLETNYNDEIPSLTEVDSKDILKMWQGFHYVPNTANLNEQASASLGTSFYYSFI